MMLKSRCTTAARLAVRLAPTLASSAVTQVPMFCPKRMNSDACRLIAPVPASACKIPTLAELLCKSAVTPAPTSTPTKGFLAISIMSRKPCQSRSGSIASVMASMPTNRMPSPIMICPKSLKLERFPASWQIAPTAVKRMPKLSLTESISEVTVVPMLAPMMTPMALLRDRSPALTKPTTITVVALEDWITAVTSRPTSTAVNLLRVRASKRRFILLPAACSKPSPIVLMPKRNRPRPPSSENTVMTSMRNFLLCMRAHPCGAHPDSFPFYYEKQHTIPTGSL